MSNSLLLLDNSLPNLEIFKMSSIGSYRVLNTLVDNASVDEYLASNPITNIIDLVIISSDNNFSNVFATLDVLQYFLVQVVDINKGLRVIFSLGIGDNNMITNKKLNEISEAIFTKGGGTIIQYGNEKLL